MEPTISKPVQTKRIRPTNHHKELRRRSTIDCSSPLSTDQSFLKSCNINNIMAQYAKTGTLPQTSNTPRYIDCTTIPELNDAFNIVNSAMDTFFDLPAPIRKLMDNDPSKLENFISDEKNHQILMQHGMLVTPQPKQKTQEELLTEISQSLQKTTEPTKT